MGVEQSIVEVFKIIDQYWYLFAGAVVLALVIGKALAKKHPIDLSQFVKVFEKHEIKAEKLNKIQNSKKVYHGEHFLGIAKSYSETQVSESDIKTAFRKVKNKKDLPDVEKAKILQDFKPFTEVKMTIAQRTLNLFFAKIPFPFFSNDIILRLNKKDLSYYEKKILIPSTLRISFTIGNQYVVLSNNTGEQISRIHDDMMTLLTNYAFTVQTKNMEKLAGNEPIYAQLREMADRETKKEVQKKRMKSERY